MFLILRHRVFCFSFGYQLSQSNCILQELLHDSHYSFHREYRDLLPFPDNASDWQHYPTSDPDNNRNYRSGSKLVNEVVDNPKQPFGRWVGREWHLLFLGGMEI